MGIRSLSSASVSTGSKRSKFWDGSAVYAPYKFESIATTTLSSTQASVTFTESGSAWQNYTHLQLRYIMRDAGGSGVNTGSIAVSSSTGSNMAYHRLYGNGSSASAYGYSSYGYWSDLMSGAMNSTTSGIFGAGIIDILDFKNTNKNKTMRILSGADANGSGAILLGSGLVASTSAITSITLYAPSNGFVQYSHFALYGIRGS